ncbi:3-hydroxyacyl-CoA dehydrogenase family protein [Ruminococcaceae bacterium OttesenSCG-928-O06]|nr:3-hydroxyacyl-CoA dehydrogenase family protein [Ruminococcaceae bacterium OttesenSCG-928-O06]
MEKGKIAFVGCGVIGAGLAANALIAGHPTALFDTCEISIIQKRLEEILDVFVENEVLTRAQADEALKRASYTNDLAEAVTDAIFVQESIPERLELKQDTYRQIQTAAGATPVIASSASNILPTNLQEGALHPDRILVGHPFNPSYLLPVVEIVAGKQTSPETVAFAKETYEAMDKIAPICRKEEIGYLVQGINSEILQTAIRLVAEGYASAEDVDKAIMYGPGMRLPVAGQLLTIGLGVDGGWRALAQKYIGSEAPKEYLMVADGVDEEMANRPPELGNDVESILKYRDKALIGILRLQHRL